MDSQSKMEIQRCLRFLERSDISESERESAERGLNDWFCESVWDEICHFNVTCQAKETV